MLSGNKNLNDSPKVRLQLTWLRIAYHVKAFIRFLSKIKVLFYFISTIADKSLKLF